MEEQKTEIDCRQANAKSIAKIAMITYLIYIILYEALIWCVCSWAVFIMQRSGWWMLFGFLLSICCIRPLSWYSLIDGINRSSKSK